jgi:hypothetical protein
MPNLTLDPSPTLNLTNFKIVFHPLLINSIPPLQMALLPP